MAGFQAAWELRSGAIQRPSLQIVQTSAVAGLTPEPCTGLQISQFSPFGETDSTINAKHGVTSDGTLVYEVNQARLGPDGQGVNKYINHPDYPDPPSAMPWVWNVIQFDKNGNLQPLNNGGGSTNTQVNLAMFPSTYLYQRTSGPGTLVQKIDQFIQASLDVFTQLDINYAYKGIQ
jgi:hypothetical protein